MSFRGPNITHSNYRLIHKYLREYDAIVTFESHRSLLRPAFLPSPWLTISTQIARFLPQEQLMCLDRTQEGSTFSGIAYL